MAKHVYESRALVVPMTRMQRAVILTELIDRLTDRGSWCTEAHVQNAAYFLQELLAVPTRFEFIHCKHAPYSFDLGDELTALCADELLTLKVRHRSFGPSYLTTDVSQRLRERFPVTLRQFSRRIGFVAEKLGAKGVAELQRLATALFVTRDKGDHSVSARTGQLHALKPHVPLEQAEAAIEEFDGIAVEAVELIGA